MKFLVDENVSQAVTDCLNELGHEAISIVESKLSGINDQKIFQMTVKTESILITRDYHFTNNLLFPAEKTKGIIYIRKGNLTSNEEAYLLEKTVQRIPLNEIAGKLLTIYKNFSTIR